MGSSKHSHKDLQFASSRLNLFKSPTDPLEEHEHGGEHEHGHENEKGGSHGESPDITRENTADFNGSKLEFAKREAATTAELFYDLWFVANLTIFATVHPITEYKSLISFIGYFMLLWNNWYVTTVCDARFPQDGILNRVARACHLGVMLGFAVLGAAFKDETSKSVVQLTCFFLMASRLILAAQYGLVLLHARDYQKTRNALIVAVGLHVVPAIIYMIMGALAWRLSARVPMTVWYVVGLCELVSVVLHSCIFKTLSIEGTHFNERLNLLTLIVVGEGVIILTKNIGKIVEYTFVKGIATSWSPSLAGTIFCAGLILYMVFQLYFDWMHHHNRLPAPYQAAWTILHLPFHASLVLLAEGSTQWAIWWRATEAITESTNQLVQAVDTVASSHNTTLIVDALVYEAEKIMKNYGVDLDIGNAQSGSLVLAFNKLSNMSDDVWGNFSTQPFYDALLSLPDESQPLDVQTWLNSGWEVFRTIYDTVSNAYGLPAKSKKSTAEFGSQQWDNEQAVASGKTFERRFLIFAYMYVAAGLVIIILMLLHFLSKRKGWSPFNILRNVIILIIGLALSLVSILKTKSDAMQTFVVYPAQLPIIVVCYFVILAITHIPHPGSKAADVESNEESGSS